MKDLTRYLSASTQRQPRAAALPTCGWRHTVSHLLLVALVALLAALASSSRAHADPSTGTGPFGGEILSNPVPGPVLPAPNVFPLPPPLPAEPGFAPAPDLPGRQTFPVPGPGVVVHDGPGSGPVDILPGRVDADKPADGAGQPEEKGSSGIHEPKGKLTRVDDKYLKRKGVDAHQEKEKNDMRPPSRFDIYVDQEGKMFGVQKGTDPKYGEFMNKIVR